MTRHVIVRLSNGDWSELPCDAKLEILVVGDEALEELRMNSSADSVQVESRFGLHFANEESDLTAVLEKEE
jgi:hypothetical protein